MVKMDGEDTAVVSVEPEVVDAQRLNDFKSTVARKCQVYRNAHSNEVNKRTNVMNSLQKDLGGQSDLSAALKKYKEEAVLYKTTDGAGEVARA